MEWDLLIAVLAGGAIGTGLTGLVSYLTLVRDRKQESEEEYVAFYCSCCDEEYYERIGTELCETCGDPLVECELPE